MEAPALDRRRGGLATLIGYLVVLAVLFQDPSRGFAAASTLQGTLFVLVLPLAGLASGVYAVRGGPFSGLGLFVAGSYLALLGLTLGLGLVSAPAAASVAGLGLAVLAVVAILASLRAMWAYVRVDA